MQIVIEIYDDIYESIKNNGYIYEEDVEEVALSIISGTPLPKRHGRLIDADELLKDRHRAIPVIQVIEAQTIIEADKRD